MNVDWRQAQGLARPSIHPILAADAVVGDGAVCLDTEAVGGALRAAYPGLKIAGQLEPVNVWYVPGRSLRVVYRANRPHRPASGDSVIALEFLPAAATGARAEAARVASIDPAHVRLLPSVSAMANVFPADRGLPQLGTVLGDGYITGHVGPCGPWTLLSYLPERRCALRYARNGATGAVVVRVQTPESAAYGYSVAAAAWHAESRHFRMPRPIGYDPRAGAFWETFVPGVRLDTLLGGEPFGAAVREVVRSVVHLHTLRVPLLPREGAGVLLERTTRKVVPKAAAAFPHLRRELEAFSELLRARAGELAEEPAVTVHGDLHTANLLVDNDGVVFIDLDRMAAGDPALDLALLGTRLLLVAFDRGVAVPDVARTIAALPGLYEAAGGRPINSRTYAWYVAAMLVGRQIKTAVRHLAPNATTLAPALLGRAAAILERRRVDAAALM
jgi:hypothetical protein